MKSIFTSILLLVLITVFPLSSCDDSDDTQPKLSDSKQAILEQAKKCGKMHNEGLNMVFGRLAQAKENNQLKNGADFQRVTLDALEDFTLQNELDFPKRENSSTFFKAVKPSFEPTRKLEGGRTLPPAGITLEEVYVDDFVQVLSENQILLLNRVFEAGYTANTTTQFQILTDAVVNDAIAQLPDDELAVVLEAVYIGQNSSQYWDDNIDAWHELAAGMTLEDLIGSPTARMANPPELNVYSDVYHTELFQQILDPTFLNGTATIVTFEVLHRRKALAVGLMDLGWGIGGAWAAGLPGAVVGAVTGSAIMGLAFAFGC